IAVDDDARTLRLLVDALGSPDDHVLTFDDPETALSYLADGARCDLLVLDVEMPGVDGFGVARAVRRTPAQQGLPILALTGASEPDVAVRILEAGADAYLSKPVNIAELREVARRLIGEGAER
ncbi:MAG: response regulator, partial [Chloroflexota bacterium]